MEKTKAEGRYKQKILAKIAHEFKTPLITITTLIENLINPKDNCNSEEIKRRKLSHVTNLSNYTLYLIQDIIQYVSGEITMKISLNNIYIKDTLDFCFNVLDTLIDCNESKSRNIKVSHEYMDEIKHVSILSDELKLKQILLNLISNSVKFTTSGFIKLTSHLDDVSHDLVISVEDSGIGIKEEDFNLIFQDSIKLNLDKDYNSKGSKLGLAISKQIAVSLNYQINFDSKLGKGTRFSLRIPYQNINFDKIVRIKAPRSEFKTIKLTSLNYIPLLVETNLTIKNEMLSKQMTLRSLNEISNKTAEYKKITKNSYKLLNISRTGSFITDINKEWSTYNSHFSIRGINYSPSYNCIVVIDDQKFVRNNTINLIINSLKSLQINDFFILEGADGIDLLNLVRCDVEAKIKCIFTDENMEYLNGSEAVKIIRNLENYNKVRSQFIVSITAFDDEGTRNNIKDSGVNSVLSKPCTKTQITEILRNIFN
jgi:CheY-like chemotaxis protein